MQSKHAPYDKRYAKGMVPAEIVVAAINRAGYMSDEQF